MYLRPMEWEEDEGTHGVVGIHDAQQMMIIMMLMTPRENLHNDERMLSHERVCLISVCHLGLGVSSSVSI